MTVHAPINEMVSLNAGWLRPSAALNKWGTEHYAHSSVDLAFLTADFKGEGYKISPWGMIGLHGNGVRSVAADGTETRVPALDMMGYGYGSAMNGLDSRTTVYWAGVGGELSLFDPFRFTADFIYSGNDADGRARRSGWYAALGAEMKTSWATPFLRGWYASGDDADSEGSKHKECTVCGEKLETQPIEKIYNSATTDSKGEAVVGGYLVTVTDTDTKNPVANAAVALHKDNSISIRLPNSRLLDYADQTTVTVQLVKDKSAVPDMSIAVTDKNDNYASGKTDKAGQITVPTGSGKTNEDGKVTTGYEDADGDRWTLTVKVIRTDTKRPISGSAVSIGKTGNITVKLPDGTDLDAKHQVTVIVTDHKKAPQQGKNVTVKGDLGQSAAGKTDKNGELTVPEVEQTERHGVYIVGYTDGTFGPSRSMTRSEAAAIFARLLAEKNGDTITTAATTKFADIPAHAWYSGYVKYLSNNGITYGKSRTVFAPNDAITRAEFTTMAVRFFDVYGDGDAEIMEQFSGFHDVSSGYWAAEYIKYAALHGWINGYGDGSFHAEREINRAEVVTIVNRLLGREADEDYIADNLRKLNTFPDVTKRHWAYYAVMEAANAHTAVLGESESWSK